MNRGIVACCVAVALAALWAGCSEPASQTFAGCSKPASQTLAEQYNLCTLDLDVINYLANEDPDVYWQGADVVGSCLNVYKTDRCPFAEPEISISGTTVTYVGSISIPGVWRMFRAVERHLAGSGSLSTLHIDSNGGASTAGLAMAEWVADSRLDVEMENRCASACANYIFPAGVNKTIMANTPVSWHGASNRNDFIGQALGFTPEAYLARFFSADQARRFYGNLPQAELEEKAMLERRVSQATRDREQKFFKRLNVDIRIANIGMESHTVCELFGRGR